MRHFRLSIIALLILILTVSMLVGCITASGDKDWENKYATLKIENTLLKTDMETAKADVVYLKSALEKSKAEYDTLKSEHSTLKATYKKLQADYDLIQNSYDALRTDYDTVQADYESLKTDSILYSIALSAQIADYNSLKTSYDSLKALYDELFEFVKTVMSSSTTLPTYPTPTPTNTTWIDEYEATYRYLPIAPDWLAPIINGLDADGRINRQITLTRPSAQYWSRRSPSEQNMILELVSWLGGNPDDFVWSIYN